MYCLRQLERNAPCHTCRQAVVAGLAGFYYNYPLCGGCFTECDPKLAALLSAAESLSDASLQIPRGLRAELCAGCHQPIHSWIVGRHLRDLFCRRCFRGLDPRLASVLILEEAVRALVEDGAPSSQYLELARHYTDAHSRLAE